MSKTHFDTKSVEIVTDDDGDRYIGQDDVKRIFNDSNLHRQSIIDGNRDGVKYTTMAQSTVCSTPGTMPSTSSVCAPTATRNSAR